MRIDLELKNYRCFPDNHPVRFSIQDRFASFVGINNAGKSSLVRFFYEFRGLFSMLSGSSANIIAAFGQNPQGPGFNGVADVDEIFNDTNDRDIQLTVGIEPEESASTLPPPDQLIATIGRSTRGMTLAAKVEGREIASGSLRWGDNYQLHDDSGALCDFTSYFLAFQALTNSIYIGPFRNAINVGSNENYYDLAVGQAFISSWQRFKSGPVKSDNRAALQLTEDIRRIFGFKSLEINASQEGQTLQVIIDGRSYRLHELGAGMAHFIIVLAYVATRRPDYVFIDEPELNLHPALQLDFLTTLGTYTKRGSVLFSTHSIGLARAASEVVYSVRRLAQGESELSEYDTTPRLAEFLGELSFAGYQELGFDKVLLVEGPTDVTAFQRLLRLYGSEHQVVVMPLSGASLINAGAEAQLLELQRITKNISAVIDSERTGPGKSLSVDRMGFKDVCDRVSIPCHVLDRRALENYFPESAIQAVKGQKYRALGPYEKLADANPAWAKGENWRIAGQMERSDLAATDLDTFLSSLNS